MVCFCQTASVRRLCSLSYIHIAHETLEHTSQTQASDNNLAQAISTTPSRRQTRQFQSLFVSGASAFLHISHTMLLWARGPLLAHLSSSLQSEWSGHQALHIALPAEQPAGHAITVETHSAEWMCAVPEESALVTEHSRDRPVRASLLLDMHNRQCTQGTRHQ